MVKMTSLIVLFFFFISKKKLGATYKSFLYYLLRAFTAVKLKSYNAILAPLIYQIYLTAVVVKQKIFADLLQCTSIYRCAL